MGGACSAYGVEESIVHDFGCKMGMKDCTWKNQV
jgi:hypothetical protein